MVTINMGLPDPPDYDSSLSVSNDSNDIIPMNTEDDDFDGPNQENPYAGYRQLPLNGNEELPANDSDSDEFDDTPNHIEVEPSQQSNDVPAAMGVPPIDSTEKVLLQEVWSQSQSKDIEMDPDKVEAVKEAMANITLPPANIPEWASSIPEDEWKAQILKKIHLHTARN